MRIRIMRIFKYLSVPMLSMLVLIIGIGGISRAVDLPKVINKKNCAQYKDLLIPAMYRAVERGDYIVTPGKINFKYKHTDSFLAASAKNEGKFDIRPDGDLIDKQTGKYPENIYGFPFPTIDSKDTKAGTKIIFNFDFQKYRFMGAEDETAVIWIHENEGMERYMSGKHYIIYLNGRPPGSEMKNPDKLLSVDFHNVLEPMSVKGTNTMGYVYMGTKEDAKYSYVPAIRRVRQSSAASRSDSYMGSDAWLDNGLMWGGKTKSMTWTCVGEKTILVSFTSPDMLPTQNMPDGSMARVYPFAKRVKFGFDDPNWKGAKWASQDITYIPRKVWIVEQMPKDPYYNWGLHVNYIDQETYTIWYKEVYERSGDFRTWLTFYTHYSETPSGESNTGDWDCIQFTDEKNRHSTAMAIINKENTFIYLPASKLNLNFFSVNNFLLLSK